MSNHPLLKVEISQLSIAERIQLAEDLWDSILEQQDELPSLMLRNRNSIVGWKTISKTQLLGQPGKPSSND